MRRDSRTNKARPRVVRDFGPWTGVRAVRGLAAGDKGTLRAARNVYLFQGAWRQRPGILQLPKLPVTGQAQGVRCVSSAGDWVTFAVAGGKLFRLDWGTLTWADVTPAGRVINTTGRVYLVGFAGEVVVSDGVNNAWAYDPVTNTGRNIPIATGPWYGQPVVYYAKLFWINAANRIEIGWSEEGTLDLGGTISITTPAPLTYNNAWELRQTAEEPLVALAATNAQLYYFREASIGAIGGAVSTDFQTTGVHDGVSSTVGTLSPMGVHVENDTSVWFIDQLGVLCRVAGSSGVERFDDDTDADRASLVDDQLAKAWLAPARDVGAMLCALPRVSTTLVDVMVFSLLTDGESRLGSYWGTWAHGAVRGVDFALGAECVDDTGERRVLMLDTDGDAYVLQARIGTLAAFDRYLGSVTVPVPEVRVETHFEDGDGLETEVVWDTVTVLAGDPESLPSDPGTAVSVRLATERAGFPAVPKQSRVPRTGRLVVGRVAHGRTVRVRLDGTAEEPSWAGEDFQRFLLHALRVEGAAGGVSDRLG